ncbi:HdeD family acid-resistance protein [Paracandidimonas lactea]|uniref:HdeD family acid-resistance protein n=1 Tax=Paracandidimonas lactea TaxID=2895524 RepID=UPI001F449A5D|nr:HdeD family acid-resistance protein [Paracandidimonas lactea]
MKQPHEIDSARVAEALAVMREKRGWFLTLGVLLLILGVVAAMSVLAATVASVLVVGIMMLIGGVGMLIHAWKLKGLGGFLLWTLSGVLYLAAGFVAFYDPLAGAAVLTLLLGATLIASGVFRLWVWLQNRGQPGGGWLALSGVISVLAGLLIAAGWPQNSVWILGVLLSIDLIFQGIMLIMLALALRRTDA